MAIVATFWLGMLLAIPAGDRPPIVVRIPLDATREVDVSELVSKLSEASGLSPPANRGAVKLPLDGRGAPLTLRWLAEACGPGVRLGLMNGELTVTLTAPPSDPSERETWARTLSELSSLAEAEIRRRSHFGFHARTSYRPSDPARPTVVLVHGLNSTSGVFRHLFPPLETAGFGILTYDFPYNQDLDESSADFRRNWSDFRRRMGDSQPWAVVAHSMGSLLARSYVEDDGSYARDVRSLILIAPPNQGSTLVKAQTLLQTVKGVQALRATRKEDALSLLGDGVGMAADDMTPGSRYLATLNAGTRRATVRYHILAGDVGYLDAEGRRRFEAIAGARGFLGGLGKALASGLSESLDEITDGLGDGCVSVASTRLGGVSDHRVLHANHLELIRAPLLYPDAGPVAAMPDLLRWLGEDAASGASKR